MAGTYLQYLLFTSLEKLWNFLGIHHHKRQFLFHRPSAPGR